MDQEQNEPPRADFRFPQDEDHEAVKEVAARSSVKTGWTASFIDYVYISLSNSMDFSPPDTTPLSARTKSPMGLEAFWRLRAVGTECPNSDQARNRLEDPLAALGRKETKVHMRLLKTLSDIKGSGFAGSPTITVDGADIFPTGAPASKLACRVYQTPHGLAGTPTIDQPTEALKKHGL